jgi:3D (Asp-Asp-Asp) domain-containing protein
MPKGTKKRRSCEVYIEKRLPAFFLIHLLADLQRVEKGMTWLTTVVGLGLLLVSPIFAGEHSALARVTVYWHSENSGANAAWNGARLRDGHCAVDPRKIPYGSQVVFHDAECVAVDSGPDVVNRKAARLSGRTGEERNAIVIDRFFETKQKAHAWAKANPHFMVVQVCTPDT